MDITNNTTTTTTTTTICSVKTTEAETETTQTPIRIQPVKPISFSNGVLKRHNSLNHGFNGNTNNNHHHHPVVVIYKECLRNHAASLGGHAVDGCGEFMPSPSSNPTDPTSLKCAACGCHRNFHRREPEEPPLVVNHNPIPALEYQPHHRHHPPPPPPPLPPPLPQQQHGGALDNLDDSPSPPPISSAYYPASAPHMLLALSSGPLIDTTTQLIHNPNASTSNPNSRKRFRTKFTQTQKEKMLEFAERVGWKIQKKDEEMINEFCRSIGVEKGVLKVWMHNNKNTFGKKVSDHGNANGSVGFGFVGRNMNNTVDTCMRNTTATNATGGMEFQLQHERSNENDHKDHNSVAAHVVTTNGNGVSSSS